MARKKIDLTDQRFGRLKVVKELPREGSSSPRWLCKCDCGNDKISTTKVLRRGDCKSCGCLHKEYLKNRHSKTDTDITGIRFGRLTAIKKSQTKIRNGIAWECKCDCGNIVEVMASELKIGHVKSCGCINEELPKTWVDGGTNVAALKANTLSKRNKSGIKGVGFDKSRGKWTADIMFQGKRYRLGRFDEKKDAAEARKEAENRLHGDFLEWYDNRNK